MMPEIDHILQNEITRSKSPSVQYILFDKDSILKEYSLGLADIAANKKITAQTTYHAYSVTKTFTALAILQLAERGSIDIDQPIRLYLPAFPYPSDITTRQILSHTSGIPNPIPLSWIHLATEHNSFDRNVFFKTILLRNVKTKTRPNQKFAYSNLGYVILGQLIEQITGSRYEDYITHHIIQRLDPGNSELGFEIKNIQQHAKAYHKKLSISNLLLGLLIDQSKFMGKVEGKWKPFKSFYVNGVSYGGLIGTPRSFVRYIQQLLRPDSQLLSDSYKKMLFTETQTNNGRSTGMCLSWFKGQLNGHTYYTHAGGGGGYYCEIRIYPGKEMGSVIFFNRTGMSDERFLDKVDGFYFPEVS